MSTPYYVAAYQSASRRYAEGCKDDLWQEWLADLVEIRAAWAWSVAGMLTQLETNDPEIWHALGDTFQAGHGIERDVERAEEWFRKAAENGRARSMVSLGLLLRREGRNPDELAESLQWFRRAADLGDDGGMIWLGFAYREGTGVPVDERAAADWFIKAHAAGAKNAANLAGGVLASRREDHYEAVKWLRTAVEEGNELSHFSLARIYEDRNSPAYDAEAAFCCWILLAERQHGDIRFEAMFTLACCCRDGIGTACDRQQAKRWLDRVMTLAPKEKSDYRRAAKLRKEIDEELF